MKQLLLFSLLVLSAVSIEVQPREIKEFFKGVAINILQGVSSDSDDGREIADTLADVIAEDCQSVCPPAVVGDLELV